MGDSVKDERWQETIGQLPLSGEPLPLELVNTTYIKGGVRGRLVDVLAEPPGLDAWLADRRDLFSAPIAAELSAAGPAGRTVWHQFQEVRRALRSLAGALTAGAAPGPADVTVVNAFAGRAVAWQELAPGPEFRAVGRRAERDPVRAALGEIAAAAVTLFGAADAERLRACPAPGCILYFVKSHARREWCTVGCGNRVRVARHSRRVRDGGPS